MITKTVSDLTKLNRCLREDELCSIVNQEISLSDVADWVSFEENSYKRNIIAQNEYFELYCICWLPGQSSPIHNHGESLAGMRVLKGTAQEKTFEVLDANGHIRVVSDRLIHPGESGFEPISAFHVMKNPEGQSEGLITLHLYSPPLKKFKTLNLLDEAER